MKTRKRVKKMAKYEVRKSGNHYYPWTVIDTETGENESEYGSNYGSEAAAQRIADKRNAGVSLEQETNELFNLMIEANERYESGSTTPVQVVPPTEEAEFVGSTYKVGDEITDKDGNIYVAIQPSYYISNKDAADLEDGWDAQVSVGWHTPARLKSQSTEVIVEQVQTGQAKIVRREGKTCVLFHDEWQAVPLDDLAYSSELGLYRKSVFPDVRS